MTCQENVFKQQTPKDKLKNHNVPKTSFHIVVFLMNRLGVDILLVYVDSRVVFL